jgi:hypothetical protein
MPIILATEEAEIRRSSKPASQIGGVVQNVSPEFKPQYCNKKNLNV